VAKIYLFDRMRMVEVSSRDKIYLFDRLCVVVEWSNKSMSCSLDQAYIIYA
jgi:hypothetical protein